MAKLTYAQIIERDQRYRILADLGLRLDFADTPKLMPRLVDWAVAEHLLLLAESRSILNEDGYWLAESDQAKRKLIKEAYELHRYKGTPYAIKKMLRTLGCGEVRIHEGGGHKKHDAIIRYRDGFHQRGSTERWAHYQIEFLSQPIQKKQIEYIRRCIQHYAPARCVLVGFKQARGTLKHNGHAQRNGQYSRGQIWLN